MSKPLSSDAYDILLGHNRWAIRELLVRARDLSDSQFHCNFDIGPGSLHDTLTHVVGVIGRWTDRINQSPVRPRIDGRIGASDMSPMPRRTPDELLALLESSCDEFAACVARAKEAGVLAEVRDWTFGDEVSRFNVAAAVIHVTNHGMHHRAQCMNMFKRLGHPVNADLDELEWQVAGEP